jgi:hypothetical protein
MATKTPTTPRMNNNNAMFHRPRLGLCNLSFIFSFLSSEDYHLVAFCVDDDGGEDLTADGLLW